MNQLNDLESQVLERLLASSGESLACLREQLPFVEVISREMTGVGFFTTFAIGGDAKACDPKSPLKLGDVVGTASNLQNGLGFLLYVDKGFLAALEGYTYDEPWPSEIKDLRLSSAPWHKS